MHGTLGKVLQTSKKKTLCTKYIAPTTDNTWHIFLTLNIVEFLHMQISVGANILPKKKNEEYGKEFLLLCL